MLPSLPRAPQHSRVWALDPGGANASIHIHDAPTGDALALKLRPTGNAAVQGID
jgi:hypothetical protein